MDRIEKLEQELLECKVKAKVWEEEARRLREVLHKRDMDCINGIKDSMNRIEEMLGATDK